MKQRKAPPTEEEEEEDVDAETSNGKAHVKNVSSSQNQNLEMSIGIFSMRQIRPQIQVWGDLGVFNSLYIFL